MWAYSLDPVLLQLGFLQIRWYGVIYAFGFLLSLWFLLRYRGEIGLSKDEVYDFVFYLMLGVVIGARLFHVVFWEPSYYVRHPIEIFYGWQGGLAFHGGLVGALLVAWLYCTKKKIPFLKLADVLSIPAMIGLGLGRIGNFINKEIVGTVTNVSWCANFGDGLCRHPYVLYSAAKRFMIAGLLYWLRQSFVLTEGFLFWLMLFLLGVGRFFLDYVREDVRYYGLSVGQWMSLVMALIGGTVLLWKYRTDLRKILK